MKETQAKKRVKELRKQLDYYAKLYYDEDLTGTFRYDQEQTIFRNGILKAQLYCNIVLHSNGICLSEIEKKEIDEYIAKRQKELIHLNIIYLLSAIHLKTHLSYILVQLIKITSSYL